MKGKSILCLGILLVFCSVFIAYDLTMGDGLSCKYISESGRYTVEFLNPINCKWYQDSYSFNGSYKKIDNNSYRLSMIGHSGYIDTVFTARKEGNNLRITGGIVNSELFVKHCER